MPDGARLLLAIDTSTESAGIALHDGERVSELNWRAGRNQTTSLLSEIRRLLTLNGYHLSDLGAVSVATGPGSFSGLRVGMSIAKGLAYGLYVPIVGVVTLDVVAYPHAPARMPIRAFVPAGRGRVVFADYQYRFGKWVRLSDMRNERLEGLTDGLGDRTLLTGELTADQGKRIEAHPHAMLPSPALRLRRASYLAEIAFDRWDAGETDELESLDVVYVHGSSSGEKVSLSTSWPTS